MKKIIVILLIVFIHPFSAEAELSKKSIESIGRFLILDYSTSKLESGQHRKPLTNYFYVKETGLVQTIAKKEINSIKHINKPEEYGNIIISDGKYKEIEIINEVSGLGCLLRKAFINEKNQVFWDDSSYSLRDFSFATEMGTFSGAWSLLKIEPKFMVKIISGCQQGKIPIRWKPTKTDLVFYINNLNFMFYIFSGRP